MRATLVAIGCLLVLPSLSPAKDIVRCGQSLGPGEVGTLQADLDCPATPGSCIGDDTLPCTVNDDCPAVAPFDRGQCSTASPDVGRGATLSLNGHSITTHNPDPLHRVAIVADSSTILGPGDVSAPDGVAIVFGGKSLRISDVVLHDSNGGLDAAFGGKIRATNVTAVANAEYGIANTRSLVGKGLVVSDNGAGSPYVRLGFGSGIIANRVRIDGMVGERNAGAAVFAGSASVQNASLTGNDGFGLGLDIVTQRRPHLKAVACGRSGRYLPSPPSADTSWGVCASD